MISYHPQCRHKRDTSSDMIGQIDRDYYFMLSDFSQIELRILADLSGDSALISALSDPTRDFFEELAMEWLYVSTHTHHT